MFKSDKDISKYRQYADDVLSGKIVACELVKLTCKRYIDRFSREDIYFNADKVNGVVCFIQHLSHFSGRHAGKPFILEPFQLFIIYNIFGFYWKKNNKRVTRSVYIELARKNGKSALISAINLYLMLADGEQNAELELVASTHKQALIMFDMCKNFAQSLEAGRSKKSKKKKKSPFIITRDKIRFEKTHSFIQVLSSDAKNLDGFNAFAFSQDEFHESGQNDKLYNVMRSSQGARENPLAICITTAGFNMFSFCYQMRTVNIEILKGLKQDESQFTLIYTLDEGDDWRDRNVWIKANPNMGVTVYEDYIEEQVKGAMNNSALEIGVRTKNLNQWLTSSKIWISNNIIENSSADVNINAFNKENCFAYVGVDLAAVSDFTAMSLMIPKDGKFYFKTNYYLPSICLSEGPNAELYKQWYKDGYLTVIEGNVTDYDYIAKDLKNLSAKIPIVNIGFDKWNSVSWALKVESMGLPLEEYGQNIYNFNKPTREFERLIKGGKVVIDNNPITRFCFANVILKEDWNENVKPMKEKNENKIDGVISMLTALGIYLSNPTVDTTIV